MGRLVAALAAPFLLRWAWAGRLLAALSKKMAAHKARDEGKEKATGKLIKSKTTAAENAASKNRVLRLVGCCRWSLTQTRRRG